jgi:muramoyltetrapeptide carboxypeptidase
MVAHLVGTPHFPTIAGGILVLEDVGEQPYRLERMLYQLHFAGVLARQRALLLGSFTGFDAAPNDNGYDLPATIAHARAHFGVPIYAGLPFGHCRDKLTLPFGGHGDLKVEGGIARLRLSGYAVAPR